MPPRRVRRMPPKRTTKGPVPAGATIVIDTTLGVDALLRDRVATGLYGRNVSEAAERVICYWLQDHPLPKDVR